MDIRQTLAAINRLEAAQVIDRWAVGGATGATFFLEPLVTEDVDIFVRMQPLPGQILVSLQPIYEALRAEGVEQVGEYLVIAGWPVQFLPPTSSLVEEALDQAIETKADDVPVRVLSAEHLAAIALQTGRAKDKARVQQFVEAGVLDQEKFEAILSRHDLKSKWRDFERQFAKEEP